MEVHEKKRKKKQCMSVSFHITFCQLAMTLTGRHMRALTLKLLQYAHVVVVGFILVGFSAGCQHVFILKLLQTDMKCWESTDNRVISLQE